MEEAIEEVLARVREVIRPGPESRNAERMPVNESSGVPKVSVD